MGSLVKMKITGYSDEKFASKVGDYLLMLNPESLKWDRNIAYNEQQSLDSSKSSSKYKETPAETLSFDIIIDCTGVVDDSRIDLQEEIDGLKKVTYDYNSDIHRPNFVTITWGSSLTFQGILKSFDTTYTLFKPDGTPLRAKISLNFSSYMAPATAAKKEGKNSPDLTHLVTVKGGDTLPQLSARVFGTSRYYVQLAQFNRLDKFRQLKPGQVLTFPPIVSGSSQ
ncbi:MAG TPA: LysM peptidoglycan-binding domain-containing protein [Candidatus Acidoferrum sp.]|nr:LysM peptidoglycan-binding domain-containing protein [Candidatus Acidoferrum sp.]